MDGTREQGRGARGVDFRATTWLAWSLWTLVVATIGFGFLLWPVSSLKKVASDLPPRNGRRNVWETIVL